MATELQETTASTCLRELVRHVMNSASEELDGISYKELALRSGYTNKHAEGNPRLARILGVMGHLLRGLEGGWGEEIPHIQSLVIRKHGQLRGLPDEGIEEFWPDYPTLTRAEKRNKVRAEYVRVSRFGSRWNDVLRQLNIEEIQPAPVPALFVRVRGGGGESAEHQRLKHFVANNPQAIGIPEPVVAFIEYTFPSLDAVDVLFKADHRWIAVEVKSRVSDHNEDDYLRGIYQCVKYRALLKAMRLDSTYAIPDQIDSFLVLESALPSHHQKIARRLNVQVIEGIHVPDPTRGRAAAVP